jgi:fido (protein-threonine AMPylation protein)
MIFICIFMNYEYETNGVYTRTEEYQQRLGKLVRTGIYRSDEIFAGSLPFPKPSKISEPMRSMIQNLDKDLTSAVKSKELDPCALAAKYADRIVIIHPFRDGNRRICRTVLNAILIKYAGIVVNVGEHNQNRDEYVLIEQESTKVGGHSTALGTLALKEAIKALRNMRDRLKRKKRE